MTTLRILRYLIPALIIPMINSCEKGNNSREGSFICLVNTTTDSDFITRSCFQLSDGSYIIAGTGQEYAVMAKFSEKGDFIWQKRLPGSLFGLKKGIPLPTGGFLLAGADSVLNSSGVSQSGKATIIKYDTNGEVTYSLTINSTPFSSMIVQLDMLLLKNGTIALGLVPQAPFSFYTYPRLHILNQNLTSLFDQVYYASPGVPFSSLVAPRLQEAADGSLYFCFQNDSFKGSLLKLNSDYSLNFYTNNTGLGSSELPGSMAIDNSGNICIATARQINPSQLNFVFYHPLENWSYGNDVSVIRTDTAGNFLDRHDFNGFPPYGSVMKIIRTSDGGFMMVGTSNQNALFTTVSNTQLFLIKTDVHLNRQWMKQMRTSYPAVGYDVVETRDGGYAMGAFERSFNKNFKMMIIKTDANGN